MCGATGRRRATGTLNSQYMPMVPALQIFSRRKIYCKWVNVLLSKICVVILRCDLCQHVSAVKTTIRSNWTDIERKKPLFSVINRIFASVFLKHHPYQLIYIKKKKTANKYRTVACRYRPARKRVARHLLRAIWKVFRRKPKQVYGFKCCVPKYCFVCAVIGQLVNKCWCLAQCVLCLHN